MEVRMKRTYIEFERVVTSIMGKMFFRLGNVQKSTNMGI